MSMAIRTLIASLAILLMLLLPIGIWRHYEKADYTAGELIDYAMKRLDGHPRLSAFASPLLVGLSSWIGYTPKSQRAVQPFIVPAPPTLFISSDFKTILASANTNQPHILRVGPSKSIKKIAQAATLARDGDIIEIDAGEYHGDVAVWSQKSLTIRGIGGNVRIFSDGITAEGKAIWVIRSGTFTIENIEFIGAHVPDRNGAGIRFEGGSMHINNCLFFGNENGLLTSDNSASELEISDSEFSYNGSGDGYSHNLYVGKIHSLKVSGSYFHHANVGHLLKSRAEVNDIKYNRLTDEDGGRVSYELDIPNGGVSNIIGNIIQQNQEAENSTIIAYGEEGYSWPSNNLYLASNTLVNDLTNGGIFLKAAPGLDKIISINNLLVGDGDFSVPASVESINDFHADWGIFVSAPRQDYRLNIIGQKFVFVAPPAQIAQEIDLTPRSEYQQPRHTKKLSATPSFPGALQSVVQ
jgi:hypothetical protein